MPKSKLTPVQIASKKAALKNESKADRFVRLATARVTKVLQQLKHLGNLGGPSYESTEMQRKSIQTAITAALTTAIDRMNKVKAAEQSFKL
jgi:signal transduction histidine kinase